jgi:hypothetical protein
MKHRCWIVGTRETKHHQDDAQGLSSTTLLTPWMIWKHKNDCIFNNARPSASILFNKIKDESMHWAKAGALELGDVLPST